MSIKLPNKAIHALFWITNILNKNSIPFQVTGGFAAKLYGSPRPLNDIDFDIPRERFAEILEDVRPYIILGPVDYKDERWDVHLMTLNYHNQEIDIGSSDTKIHDDSTGRWVDFSCDLGKAVTMDVAGMRLPVVPRKDLIAYKKFLIGEHQKVDIRAISETHNSTRPAAPRLRRAFCAFYFAGLRPA